MSDKRKARTASARLSANGYLRLSSDLVPADARQMDLKFVLVPLPSQRQLQLRVVINGSGIYRYLAKRKALYSNSSSRCPMVTVKSAMKFLGIRLPKKSVEFPVRKRKGILTVQF